MHIPHTTGTDFYAESDKRNFQCCGDYPYCDDMGFEQGDDPDDFHMTINGFERTVPKENK